MNSARKDGKRQNPPPVLFPEASECSPLKRGITRRIVSKADRFRWSIARRQILAKCRPDSDRLCRVSPRPVPRACHENERALLEPSRRGFQANRKSHGQGRPREGVGSRDAGRARFGGMAGQKHPARMAAAFTRASVNYGRLLQKLYSTKFEMPGFRRAFCWWGFPSVACFFSVAAISCDMRQAQSAPIAQKLVWPRRRSRGKISIPANSVGPGVNSFLPAWLARCSL